jgi:hypothetical protein
VKDITATQIRNGETKTLCRINTVRLNPPGGVPIRYAGVRKNQASATWERTAVSLRVRRRGRDFAIFRTLRQTSHKSCLHMIYQILHVRDVATEGERTRGDAYTIATRGRGLGLKETRPQTPFFLFGGEVSISPDSFSCNNPIPNGHAAVPRDQLQPRLFFWLVPRATKSLSNGVLE